MKDYAAILALPFGRLGLVLDANDVLYGLEFLPPHTAPQAPASAAAHEIEAALQAWCSGASTQLDLHYKLQQGTPFQHRVWQAMLEIPCGETRSYGEMATRLGSSPRAIGGACGRNPLPVVIPCHRIVARQDIGGFNQGRDDWLLDIKYWLLRHELRLSHKENGALFAR